jgi:hypothetical protein
VRLLVAVLLSASPPPQPPPGVDPDAYRHALADDTVDVVAALAGTSAAVACAPADRDLAEHIAWPGMPVLPATTLAEALIAATGQADLVAVVPADVPDLPGLLVGKLFSALEDVPVSVLPAAGGGLAGLSTRLPEPAWLVGALPEGLDTPVPVARLHAAAPPRSVVVGPGWHRLRAGADVTRLDPGLDGWDATRRLLAGG